MIRVPDLDFPIDAIETKQVVFPKYKADVSRLGKRYQKMPACYEFYNPDTGEIYYAGKAIQAKNRILQHLHDDFICDLLDEGNMISVRVWFCNEKKRIQLEQMLIKHHNPTYNVMDGY